MSEHAEHLVGTLFEILEEEGYDDLRRALLGTYNSTAATADRGALSETLLAAFLDALEAGVDPKTEVDVLVTAVERLFDRLTAVIDAAPVAILVVDDAGAIRLWNDGAERLFGWSERRIRGQRYPETLAVGEPPPVRTRLAEGDRIDGLETRHAHRDGTVLDVRVWGAPFGGTEGDFAGGVVVISDFTAQKQREQRLAVLNRVLRHNIRNDVTAAKGHLELLAADATGERREHARVVERKLDGIAELGEAARRIEGLKGGTGERTAVDVAAVLRRRLERLRAAAPDAEIDADLPEEASVRAHELLPYAVGNVLENAVEHNPADRPRVCVHITRETPPADRDEGGDRRGADPPIAGASPAADGGSWIALRIADDGPGLPPLEREVLTAGTETPLSHSQGVGIWLTRWIVRASGGTIEVTESEFGGTAVTMYVRPAAE